MLARFCSRSKALEAFSARARLGSKIISCDIARARLGSKNFSLGSLELEKYTLVPNTNFAIMYEQIHTASVLIKHGSNVQSSCNSGNTPLHMACARNLELSRLLIDNGADINAVNARGQTPIRFAISTNQFQVVNMLAKEGASIKEYLPLIKTAILQLFVNGHLYLLQAMLENSHITQERRAKYIEYSVAYGQNQIFDLLWSRGTKCSTEQMEEFLELASMKGNSYILVL